MNSLAPDELEVEGTIYKCDTSKKEAFVIATNSDNIILKTRFFSPIGFSTYVVTRILSAKELVPNMLKSIVIPQSLRVICRNAFIDCRNLKRVEFESNSQLQIIDDAAFCRCWALETITVPKTVIRIGNNAFIGCIKLNAVVFERDCVIQELGDHAFAYCKALSSFEFPNTLTHVGSGLLHKCPALQSVKLGANFDDPLIHSGIESAGPVFTSIDEESLRNFRSRRTPKISVNFTFL